MECLAITQSYTLELITSIKSVELNAIHLVDHQELKLSHETLLAEVELERFVWKESTEKCESSRAANHKLTGEVVALQSEKQKLGIEVQKLGIEVQKLGIELMALQREKLLLECEKRVLCDKVHQLESTHREVHEERSEQLSSLEALVARKEKEVDALLLECQAGKDDLRASLDRSRCEAMQLQVENTRLKEKLIKINVSTKQALVDLRSTGRGGDRKLVDARYAIAQTRPSSAALGSPSHTSCRHLFFQRTTRGCALVQCHASRSFTLLGIESLQDE